VSEATKPAFWSLTPEGVRIAVKVTPKARKTCLQGIVPSLDGPRLRIAVSAPPEGGKANQAACAMLAAALGVARSSVQVIAGLSSRSKLLLVSGDPSTVIARLASLG
jgi:uncharacterized protein YggU (UPF0235/DUF167 family)